MQLVYALKFEMQDAVLEVILLAASKRTAVANGLPIAVAVPPKPVELVMSNRADVDGKVAALKELVGLFKNPPAAGEFLARLLALAGNWKNGTPSEAELLLLANELLKHLGVVGDE